MDKPRSITPLESALMAENEMLKVALKEIATTRIQHLRSNQMQVALHGMKAKARLALQKCQPMA